MKKTIAMMISLFFLFSFLYAAKASTVQMNQTLVRMINQLDALFPLIDEAAKEQDKTARVQFHFKHWVDANGAKHAGLRDDIVLIRAALVNQINQSNLTPREITPMNGDYVGR